MNPQTEKDHNDIISTLRVRLSRFGQKMEYFYSALLNNYFITTFPGLEGYANLKRQSNQLVSLDKDYVEYISHGDIDIDDGLFLYKVNGFGFRSNKFEVLSDNNLNILTAGCSVSFGMGLPNEMIWPEMLKKNIQTKTDKNVRLDNISFSGIDTVQEIHNIFVYIENFGKPNEIYALLPPIYRYPSLGHVSGRMSTKQKISKMNSSEDIELYLVGEWDAVGSEFMHNIISIRKLEQYCKDLGIKLSWASWDKATNEYYSIFNFNNRTEIDFNEEGLVDKCLTETHKKYWERARDGAHPGYKHHLIYLRTFLDKI